MKFFSLLTKHERRNWSYIWGTNQFSASKAYLKLTGHRQIHPVYNWTWKSKCQMKHKVFFWLLLKHRLNTKDILQRKNMILDSYTCEMCILQERETVGHLFPGCNFAKACWGSIGVRYITTRNSLEILQDIKNQLQVPLFMEVIII